MTRHRRALFTITLIALSIGVGCSADKSGSRINGQSGVGGSTALAGAGAAAAGSGVNTGSGGSTGTAGTAAAGASAGSAGTSANAGSDAAGSMAGAAGASGAAGAGGSNDPDAGPADPVCVSTAPDQFQLNTSIGGGAGQHKDSAHFALYSTADPDTVLNFMEAAHKCFIDDWCFRTPGLSSSADDSGPYYKTNIYSDPVMSAGGLTYWDDNARLAYIHILASQIDDPRTTVHEYGHAITMSEYNWINQKRTGFWWETVANWVAYSFLTSRYCADARTAYNVQPATTIIDQMHTLTTVYNQSYSVICNDQNYYQAWPFFTYLTNNPDHYPGLGKMAVADLMRKYQIGSNETPLHTLERIAAPVKAQTILGRYWARMAYMDIDLPVGQQDFLNSRDTLTFGANLDAGAADTYTVKSSREPQYAGANITPLTVTGSGDVSVVVTNLGNGQADSNFSATLSIRAKTSGSVRYVDLPGGTGQATLTDDEEASLVVVNTPNTLYLFDPQYIGSPENIGLRYSAKITGAKPTK